MKLTEEQYQAILKRRSCGGLSFELPWPPSGNHAYTVARGRKILSSKGRDYRELAITMLQQQAAGRAVRGKLQVLIRACPPDRRARDLDNLIKMPVDCLKRAGVIEDDRHVDKLSIERGPLYAGGQFQITVQEIP